MDFVKNMLTESKNYNEFDKCNSTDDKEETIQIHEIKDNLHSTIEENNNIISIILIKL